MLYGTLLKRGTGHVLCLIQASNSIALSEVWYILQGEILTIDDKLVTLHTEPRMAVRVITQV